METIKKAGRSDGAPELDAGTLEKINAFALSPLTAEQVFTFRIAACDSQVDRDMEQFTPECLRAMAPMFIGKTVIFDHSWSAKGQTARIYDAKTVEDGGVSRLVVSCYMLRSAETQGEIDRINAGILREVSVGVNIDKASCNICGGSYCDCGHRRGEIYGGKQCAVQLEDPLDVYELSFVAVPAQREAGVVKRKGVPTIPGDREHDAKKAIAARQREARLALRKRRINI